MWRALFWLMVHLSGVTEYSCAVFVLKIHLLLIISIDVLRSNIYWIVLRLFCYMHIVHLWQGMHFLFSQLVCLLLEQFIKFASFWYIFRAFFDVISSGKFV